MTNSAVAAAAPPATLTREEVSCLKTALAMVVMKRRLQARRVKEAKNDEQKQKTTDNNHATKDSAPRTTPELSLCPWLPKTSNTSSTVACTPQHLDSMFQLAVHATAKNRKKAIAAHIRNQLVAHLDDILLQQWLRQQVGTIHQGGAASVWVIMVNHDAAVELAVRVVEELVPVVHAVLEGGSSSSNPPFSNGKHTHQQDTYCYLHLLDACLTNLLQAGRVDAIQDCLQSLADYTLPMRLSVAYAQSSASLPIVWLRMELQQLLTLVMQHVGNGGMGYHHGM